MSQQRICGKYCFLKPEHLGPHQSDPHRLRWIRQVEEGKICATCGEWAEFCDKCEEGKSNCNWFDSRGEEHYSIGRPAKCGLCFRAWPCVSGITQPHNIGSHPDYDNCACKDTWEHRTAVGEGMKAQAGNGLIIDKTPLEVIVETKPISIYLCGPMAGCTDEEMHGWREQLKKDYPAINWLDPCDRSYKLQQFRKLVDDDIADIEAADYILAYYWKTGSGSAMELAYNYYIARKPSVVVIPEFKTVSPWVRYHADYLVETFEHAMKIILNEDATKF